MGYDVGSRPSYWSNCWIKARSGFQSKATGRPNNDAEPVKRAVCPPIKQGLVVGVRWLSGRRAVRLIFAEEPEQVQ